MTHIPERTCISCRKKGDKSCFLKVVLSKNCEIYIEKDTILQGRGAYICKDNDCIEKCVKTKALNRAFKKNLPNRIYEELLSEREANKN